MVLPKAQTERDRQRDGADDQPRAQLTQVVNDAQAILVPDGSQDPRHREAPLGRV
jgi:hypothetical protein